MNIMTFILTVTMAWVILFFIALPIGTTVTDNVQKGNADSAPEKHYLIHKIIISFLLALIIAVIYRFSIYGI